MPITMFLIDFIFTAPLNAVDQYVGAHRQYLSQFYERGVLVLGGRKVPRTAGIILARLGSRNEVEDLFNAAPVVMADAARFVITEFEPVMFSPEFADIKLTN